MDKKEFIKVLDEKGYKWREEGECIIVEGPGTLYLQSLESIPDNVQFNNEIDVFLTSLESIPNNVQFNNGGDVVLRYLESIPDNVKFNNRGFIYLNSLESIPINLDHEEIFLNAHDIKINSKWLYLNQNIQFPDSRWKSPDSGRVKMYESWVKNNY